MKLKKVCCQNCGASMSGRWERLTPGLIRTLVKFKQAVIYKKENSVNPNELAVLSHTEKANFQKLRFHALVAKVRVDGEHIQGRWLLTRRGSQFLLGQLAVPRQVFVFRNEVRDHSADIAYVGEVLRSGIPTFDGIFDFEYEPASIAGAPQADFFESTTKERL